MDPEIYSFPWFAVPITIASILVPVLIFAGLMYYFLRVRNQKCPKHAEKCDEIECNKLVKKDFNHIIILFAVILVFVLVDLFIDDKSAMDYFSFASTITSIILSVLAIIMTIASENKTEGMKRQIDDSVHRLEDAANKIQSYKEELEENSKKQQEIFNDILRTSREIKEEIENLKADVKDVKNKISNQERTPANNKYADGGMKIYIPQNQLDEGQNNEDT